MLFKSLFGTGQQPWVLAGCLLETYSSSNCPAFFLWEKAGNSPDDRLGSGATLTRWLFCIRSHELWRLMDGFGLLSSTWERSWPSPMIVKYFLIRMKGISSSSSHTCNILVLGAVGHLPSLGLLLWSATVPENLSFLYKITKHWNRFFHWYSLWFTNPHSPVEEKSGGSNSSWLSIAPHQYWDVFTLFVKRVFSSFSPKHFVDRTWLALGWAIKSH